MTIPSASKRNFPWPSITAKPFVYPATSLASLCKSDLLSLLPSFKRLFSPVPHHWILMFTHCPLALIIISTLIPTFYLHARYCWRPSSSHDLLLRTSIPGYPWLYNSLSFPLPLLPLISASCWAISCRLPPSKRPKQKPKSYSSTPAFALIPTYHRSSFIWSGKGREQDEENAFCSLLCRWVFHITTFRPMRWKENLTELPDSCS